MLFYLVLRNLRASYQQSILGPVWIIINSVISVLVYSFIFGEIAKLPSDGVPYPLFTFAGMMVWGLFSNTLASTTASMSGNGMYKKVYFPRLVIPLVGVANHVVNFFLSFIVFAVMMIGYSHAPNLWILVGVPFFGIIALFLGLGVGLFFVPFDVRFRDTRHIVGYINRFLFYGTPVVYAQSVLPAPFDTLVKLNPLTTIIEGYRWSLLGGAAPNLSYVAFSGVLALVVLYIGLLFFKRNEKDFVDLS